MSKRRNDRSLGISSQEASVDTNTLDHARKWIWIIAGLALASLLTVGVFAKNGWFPSGPDPFTGARTGWFGEKLAKNASGWNPLAAPLPSATPQLSKEYIYAGSRLLAVEDANANAAPPADLAIWRPSTGGWWVFSGEGAVNQNWGTSGDDPVEGDYDGDGKTDFAVLRGTTWYIVYSASATTTQFGFGNSGDLPAQADFDGDGKTDAAIYRSGTGVWYVQQSSNSQTVTHTHGNSTDIPFPADHDGDGKADVAVWRASNQTFYSINSSNQAAQTLAHGQSGTPVSADYDGDGKADYAVFNATNANWHIRQSTTTQLLSPIVWGIAGDVPVQNDYDSDGKVDLAVWRPTNSSGQTDVGNWYIRQSASGNSLRQVQWGIAGDIPVPALYRR